MYAALIAALTAAADNAHAAAIVEASPLERVRLARLSEVLTAEARSLSKAA